MICPNCGFDNLPGESECRRCMSDLTALDRPVPGDRFESSLMTDTVGKLCPRAPVILPQGSSVAEAVRLLQEHDVGALLVVDSTGALAGIFSERDLLLKVAGHDRPLSQLRVDDFMTPKPQSVRPEDCLAFALHKMDVGGYRHLPVVRDGKPIAMLSVRDLIRHMTQLVRL